MMPDASPNPSLPKRPAGIWGIAPEAQYLPRTAGPSLVSPRALGALLARTPEKGIFIEIGTWGGATAAAIADHRPGLMVVSVDHFLSNEHRLLWLLNRRQNMRCFAAESPVFWSIARDGWAAGVFVDGDHREQGAYADLVGAARILQPARPILVHDYEHPEFPGVTVALDRFCAATAWRIVERVNELVVLERGA